MRRRPVQLDYGEEFAATLPYPLRTACPTESFSVVIPASAEERILDCRVYQPSLANEARAAQGQLRVELSTGSVLLFDFHSAPALGLLATRG